MTDLESNENNEVWEALIKAVPSGKGLPRRLRGELMGLVRRAVLHEQDEATKAVNLFRPDEHERLRNLVESIPDLSSHEIVDQVAELHLSPEEAELEIAYWPFHHQAVQGEFLIGDNLVPFRIIRLNQFTYLVIAAQRDEVIPASLSDAFGRPPSVYSDKALFVEDTHWVGWAWFLHPDEPMAARAASELREMWESMSR